MPDPLQSFLSSNLSISEWAETSVNDDESVRSECDNNDVNDFDSHDDDECTVKYYRDQKRNHPVRVDHL
jgi:hypothetical protein